MRVELAQELCFFFFNDTATTEIYTLSLHDALPISSRSRRWREPPRGRSRRRYRHTTRCRAAGSTRSEEHTSELQSPCNLVCRLLLEKKTILPTRRQPAPYHPVRLALANPTPVLIVT